MILWDSLPVSFAHIFKALENCQSPSTSSSFNPTKREFQHFLTSSRCCLSRDRWIYQRDLTWKFTTDNFMIGMSRMNFTIDSNRDGIWTIRVIRKNELSLMAWR
jgi:hypothetical protein